MEQVEKKSKAAEGEKWLQRRADEWEEFAKNLKTKAEQRAEENPGEGLDVGRVGVARGIGAVCLEESEVKFGEAVFEFVNSAWREHEAS